MYMASLLAASWPALHVLSPPISWLDVWVLRPRGWLGYEEGETQVPRDKMWSHVKEIIVTREEVWPWLGSLCFKGSWLSLLLVFLFRGSYSLEKQYLPTPSWKGVFFVAFPNFIFLMHACVDAQLCTHIGGG